MTSTALFPSLLGNDAWHALPATVQAMHGDAPILHSNGIADVAGADHFPARCLRHLLGLPPPGPQQALALTIERHGTRDGRYHFSVDVRLPLLGQLIAYEGWLEPLPDAH